MEKKTVFVKDILLQELKNDIHDAAALFTELGDVVKKYIPNAKWSLALLWILMQKAEVREYFRAEIVKKAAEKAGLPCEYDRKGTANLSQEVIINRKVVEATVTKELGVIKKLDQLEKYGDGLKNLSTYLRTGAIYIDVDGWVTVADDYAELLKTYCSVTVESRAEAAFVSAVEAMRAGVDQIKQNHAKLAELAATPQGKEDIESCGYMADRLLVGSRLRLSSDSAVWRALVTFVTAHREKDVARFFNSKGIPTFSVKEVYTFSGYLAEPTPGLRIKYPELYKNVAYRGYYSSAAPFEDTPEGVEQTREYIEHFKANPIYKRVYICDECGEVCKDTKYDRTSGPYFAD